MPYKNKVPCFFFLASITYLLSDTVWQYLEGKVLHLSDYLQNYVLTYEVKKSLVRCYCPRAEKSLLLHSLELTDLGSQK